MEEQQRLSQLHAGLSPRAGKVKGLKAQDAVPALRAPAAACRARDPEATASAPGSVAVIFPRGHSGPTRVQSPRAGQSRAGLAAGSCVRQRI